MNIINKKLDTIFHRFELAIRKKYASETLIQFYISCFILSCSFEYLALWDYQYKKLLFAMAAILLMISIQCKKYVLKCKIHNKIKEYIKIHGIKLVDKT